MINRVNTMATPVIRKGYSPYYNETTDTWWEWDEETREYVDTGVADAVGLAARTSADEAAASATASAGSASAASDSEDEAEAWARGTKDGVDVTDSDGQYHNNSKYYAEQAAGSALTAGNAATQAARSAGTADDDAEEAEAWARGTKDGTAVTSTDDQYQNNSKYYAEQAADSAQDAQDVLDSIPADYTTLSNDVTDLKNALDDISKIVFSEELAYNYDLVIGSINIESGANVNSGSTYTKNIRTNNYIPAGKRFLVEFSETETYEWQILFYSSSMATSFIERSSFMTDNNYIYLGDDDIYIRVRFRRFDQLAMTDDDIETISGTLKIYLVKDQVEVDDTLALSGYAADAAVTGTIINALGTKVGDPESLDLYTDDIPIIDDYSNGGINSDTVGSVITFSSSASYKHMCVDASAIKKWIIKTRIGASSNYPYYIAETDSNNVITALHCPSSESGYSEPTIEITALDATTKIYIGICLAGDPHMTEAEVQCNLINLTNISAKIINDMSETQADVDYLMLESDIYAELENQLLKTAKNKVMNINREAGTKCLNFAFITDTHVNGYGELVTYAKPSIALFVKNCNEKYLDCGIFGGDMYSDYNLSHDEAMDAMGEVLTEFGKITIPLYLSKGNHECNGKYIALWDMSETPEWETYYYWVVSSGGRNYTQVNEDTWDGETQLHYSTGASTNYDNASRFSREDTIQDWEHAILAQTRISNIVRNSSDPFGDYGYVDFANEKIRIVIMNGFNSSNTCDGLEQQVIDSAQLSFIENICLDLPSTDWYVLFVTHYHPTINNGNAFYDLLETFIGNGGKCLGILHGHQHSDTYYTKLSNRNWRVNFIGVRCGFVTDSSAIGTSDAYSTSIFTIDTVNQKIYETKTGVGSDRSFDFNPLTDVEVSW